MYFFIRSLENALDPSRIAAFFLGPNTLKPSASNTSTTPPTSGSSIPITVRSMLFSLANATSFSNSIALISTHSASSAIPALPGAQYILSTLGLLLNFQHIACSLPPLPTTNTFILIPPHIIIMFIGNLVNCLRKKLPFSLLHNSSLKSFRSITIKYINCLLENNLSCIHSFIYIMHSCT